ncbi:HPr kinase/phosphorylase [Roseibium sp. RKSG952]|uniref:HPr kinase/phosphorylase n=1 Tax=Roseibium sp. RKSG952 TaxID=2529384 RepID=UPI0012BCCB46|nr:HPr kinase/phosphatase C-terminal domain-containing protein [Roseibium sp. RKSG952]MTI00279.1 hypothetical protein [Roseibium sp. RKSG952]
MTRQTQHANCVVIGTLGVLILGPSGAGKSALSEHMIGLAGSKGHFAALVADDRVELTARSGSLIARVPDQLAGLLELRGFGIVETAFEPASMVHIVMKLAAIDRIERLPEDCIGAIELEGTNLPLVTVAQGRPDDAVCRLRWALKRLFPNVPVYI